MQQLEIGEEKTIAREEGSQVNHGNHNDGEGDDHDDGDGDDLGREDHRQSGFFSEEVLQVEIGVWWFGLRVLFSLFSNITHKANMLPF